MRYLAGGDLTRLIQVGGMNLARAREAATILGFGWCFLPPLGRFFDFVLCVHPLLQTDSEVRARGSERSVLNGGAKPLADFVWVRSFCVERSGVAESTVGLDGCCDYTQHDDSP